MSRSVAFLDTMYGDVTFDCVPKESIRAESVLTRHPVEFGADINDHYYVKAKTFSLEIIVSDTPSRLLESDIVTRSASGGDGTRSSQGWVALDNIRTSAIPFTLQLGLETVGPCVILNLSSERVADNAGAMVADVEISQVILVAVETTKLPSSNIKTPEHAAPVATGRPSEDDIKTETVKSLLAKGEVVIS